jgi:hypothetical protein
MHRYLIFALVLVALACSGGSKTHDAAEVGGADTALDQVAAEVAPEALTEAAADPAPEALAEAIAESIPEALEAADTTGPETTGVVPLPGFGALSGDCGVLDEALWGSPEPRLFVNHLDFADDPYDDADYPLLTEGGQKVLDDDNAGGSSKFSEAFAFEVLARCELATLLKTELEIDYLDQQGKITDLLVLVDGRKLGVSVTRAMSWPYDAGYSLETASALLEKKLQGIQASTANVQPTDAWARQVLSVLAYGEAHATVLQQAWQALPADVRADTWVYVTVSDGADSFLY